MARFLIGVTLLIASAIGASVWWWLDAPLTLASERVEASIEPGSSPRDVAQVWVNAGVQTSPRLLFEWFRWSGESRRIRAGSYQIERGTTPRGLLDKMVRGDQVMETVRLLETLGRPTLVHDRDAQRAAAVGEVYGAMPVSLAEALSADAVITVTPGSEILFGEGGLRPGQHVSLMGADGPGKAEIATAEIARAHVFCDDWEQASHGGELAAAVTAGVVDRAGVTELGQVLAGDASGRRNEAEITLFDSTGLAIQDLAIARAAYERVDALDLPRIDL